MSQHNSRPRRMNVTEFITWATVQPEGQRYELSQGELVAMAPERNRHVVVKQETWLALRNAIAEAKLTWISMPLPRIDR